MESDLTGSRKTTDHNKIREWIEQRNGTPSVVRGTDILRVDFKNSDIDLESIGWEQFFERFENNNLTFLYQERLENGELSRFNRFISR